MSNLIRDTFGDGGGAVTGAGDIPNFKNVQKRDAFFNTSPNQLLLETGLIVLVNQGIAVTTFEWTGDDQPITYDPDLFIEKALNSGPGTLFLGLDGYNINSGARVLNTDDAYGSDGIAPFIAVDGTGFSGIKAYSAAAGPAVTPINADSGTTIPDGSSALDLAFTATVISYTTQFTIIPNSVGTLRIRSWADTFDGTQVLVDDTFAVLAGDVGNQTTFDAKNKIMANIGDQQFVRFSGVDLDGAVQSTGIFTGVLAPFLSATFYICGLEEFDPATVGGGQVDSVAGGTNITIDAADPVNPVANLDAAITGTSVNGVSLTTAGSATNFLDATGSYSAPVIAATLQDVYDSGQNIITTTALGPVVLNNTGSTRAALTVTPGTVPTTNLVSGQIYSDGNDLYIYDSVRGKFLSGSERFGFGLNGAANSEYMRVGHASATNAAWIVPYDATITHITAFITAGQVDKGFEIQDVLGAVLASFNLASSEFDGTQDVDIPAGTHLRAFIVATGGTVSNSVVSVFIRRRV